MPLTVELQARVWRNILHIAVQAKTPQSFGRLLLDQLFYLQPFAVGAVWVATLPGTPIGLLAERGIEGRSISPVQSRSTPADTQENLRASLEPLASPVQIQSLTTERGIVGWFALAGFAEPLDASFAADLASELAPILEKLIGGRIAALDPEGADTPHRLRALLERNQDLLVAFVENTPAIAYILDPAGHYILANRHWESLYHISREQIIGKTMYDLFEPEAAARLAENNQQVLDCGTPMEFEEKVPYNGQDHFHHSLKFLILDEAKQPIALCGISHDITGRKKFELDLEQRNRELAALNQISALLAESLDVNAVLQTIVDQVVDLLPADRAYLVEPDETGNALVIRVSTTVPGVQSWRGGNVTLHSIHGWVYQRRELLNLPAVKQHPWYYHNPDYPEEGDLSSVFVPLLYGKEIYGVLSLSRFDQTPFTEREVGLISTFAGQATLAIRNARLYQASQLQVRQLQAIAATSRLANDIVIDPHEIVERTLAQIGEAMGVDIVGVNRLIAPGLFDKAQIWGAPPSTTGQFHMVPVLEAAFASRKPLVVDLKHPMTDHPLVLDRMERYGAQAMITAPMAAGGEPYGILNLGHRHPYLWSDEEIATANTLANQLATALRNSHLYLEAMGRLRQITDLSDLSQSCSATLDLEEIFVAGAPKAAEILGVPVCGFALLQGDQLLPTSIFGLRPFPIRGRTVAWAGFVDPCILDAQDLAIANLEDPRVPQTLSGWFSRQGIQSYFFVPLRTGAETIGILGVAHRLPHAWTSEEADLAHTVATIFASAVKNAQQFRDLKLRAELLDGLRTLGRELNLTLDDHRMMEVACELARNALKASRASIRPVEASGDRLGVGYGAAYEHPEAREHLIVLDTPLRRVLEGHEPWVVRDVRLDPSIPPHRRKRMVEEQSISFVGVPMLARDRAIGVLSVMCPEPHDWTPEEIHFLTAAGNLTALAMENARVFQEVAAEREELQAVFDSTQSGLFMLDREGNFHYWNARAQELSGWTRRQAESKNWHDLFATEAGAPHPILSETIMQNRVRFADHDLYLKMADQRRIPVELGLAPQRGPNGDAVSLVGTFVDLSEKREMERARQALLMTVTHEFNKPLTVVLGAIELLNDPKLPKAKQKKALELIRGQSGRLKHFADTFIHFDQRANELPVRLVALDVGALVRAAAKRVDLANPKHHFVIHNRARGARAMADAERIAEILDNLYDNAIKYSPHGGTIETTLEVVSDKLRISLRDEGIGIPPNELQQIFERWHRAHVTASQTAYGHGIGLWMVKTAVDKMNGTVRAESDGDHGSTFVIELPLAQE